jgi:hypothetical protein
MASTDSTANGATNIASRSPGVNGVHSAPEAEPVTSDDVALPTSHYSESELVYHRQGFFCAIEPSKNSFDCLDSAVKALDRLRDERIQGVQQVERKKIAELEEEISRIKKDLRDEENNSSLSSLDMKIERLRTELYECQRKLAECREEKLPEIIKKRLETASSDAKRLIDDALQLSRSHHEIKKRNFEDNPTLIEYRKNKHKTMLERVRETAKDLNERIDHLARSGLTRFAATVLIAIGSSGLVATGWFFSIFTAHGKLDNSDYFSFLVNRIVNALDSRLKGASPLLLLEYISGWLGISVLIPCLIWGAVWVVDRQFPRFSSTFAISSDGETAIFQHRSVFAPLEFLRIVSLVFIVGLFFILLSFLGPPEEGDLSNLLRSLSGQVAGSALALSATGIFILYLTVFVPQHFRIVDQDSIRWKRHWEFILAGCVISSVVFFTLVWQLLWPERLSADISLAWFSAALVLTVPTLGYGVWARGIFIEAERYDLRVRELSAAVEACLSPGDLDSTLISGKDFRSAWEDSYAQLIGIVKFPLQDLATQDAKVSPNLKEIEQKFFPDLTRRIDDIESDLTVAVSARDAKLANVSSSQTKSTTIEASNIERLRNSIETMRGEISAAESAMQETIEQLRLDFLQYENVMKDGFNLGLWYKRIGFIPVQAESKQEDNNASHH